MKPILRVFEVTTKPNYASKMLENFASTSIKVVENEPGNLGYYFGQNINENENNVYFVSIWKDIDAVKERFGENWQESFLPEGYAEIIETHSLKHIDASFGWNIKN